MKIIEMYKPSSAEAITFMVLYCLWAVLSNMLAAMPGEYWGAYLLLLPLAVIAGLGPRRYQRIFGAMALALALVMISCDISHGAKYRAMRKQQIESTSKAAQTNAMHSRATR